MEIGISINYFILGDRRFAFIFVTSHLLLKNMWNYIILPDSLYICNIEMYAGFVSIVKYIVFQTYLVKATFSKIFNDQY